MISIKQSLILHFLIIFHILSLCNTLECKVCAKNDQSCLFGQDLETRQCENDDDLCYTWFHRIGSQVAAQRDCMSISSPEYSLIKDTIGDKDSGCVKRVRGLDCFTFCSDNLCN